MLCHRESAKTNICARNTIMELSHKALFKAVVFTGCTSTVNLQNMKTSQCAPKK